MSLALVLAGRVDVWHLVMMGLVIPRRYYLVRFQATHLATAADVANRRRGGSAPTFVSPTFDEYLFAVRVSYPSA